jgi:hypothetical protein
MVECFCGCGRSVSFKRRSANAMGPELADQLHDWAALEHVAAGFEGTIEGLEAFVDEGRWVQANLEAYVHHDPVDPGFSNRQAARWLRIAQKLRTEFEGKVLHEAVAQRIEAS